VTGEAALVPKLEGQADELVAFGAQDRRDCGGVDSSGHCDRDRVVMLRLHGVYHFDIIRGAFSGLRWAIYAKSWKD
jgi:hypothetical protein